MKRVLFIFDFPYIQEQINIKEYYKNILIRLTDREERM